MLRRSPHNLTLDVAWTDSDAGEDESDNVGDEISSEDDSRYGSEDWDEEDENASSDESDREVCARFININKLDDGHHPGFWDDDDEDEDLDKNSEDEDSDQGSSQQDVSKAPFIKRAKTSHAVAASPRPPKNVKRKFSLTLLPTMPLDVLFEIFTHLSPMDIINLSHSSKVFHETLSSRNTPVWKAVRKRFSAPDGPDWMSEEAWVQLLFGNNCQSCEKSKVDLVDFLLLKRICISCKRRHYLSRSKVESLYPDFDFVTLLVPFTDNSPWHTSTLFKYYWNSDVDSMVTKLAALQQGADAQLLHCFMQERKRRLQCISQNSTFWRKWYHRMLLDRAQENRDAEESRLQQIKDKFKELGYNEDDFRGFNPRKECRGPGKIQMTDKIWSRIRPLLEPGLKEQKALRLERQLAAIRSRRLWVLDTRYKEFQRTLHPSQWKYLPRTLEIVANECFSRHIDGDVGVEVDGTIFDEAFLELPSLLAALTEQRKTTLRALMDVIPREDGEIRPDSIDLATAAFKCINAHNVRQFGYVFGWDDIASHHCLPEPGIDNLFYWPASTLGTAPSELKYIPEISYVVRKLAHLIGLDATAATAADFDEKDKRFACDACSCIRKEQGQYLRVGYTWRNLAVHLEVSKTHNPNLFITVLSDDAENEIKQCERNDCKWDASQWTCSHCPEYIGNLRHRKSIVEHLSVSHGIQEPSEPTDLFFFERCRSGWTTKNLFRATKLAQFRCLACVLKPNRLFMLNGVESHLQAKHNVSSGQEGVHIARA